MNGRKIRIDQLASEMERAMVESICGKVKRNLRGILDPETGKPPKIILEGQSLSDLSIRVEGSEEVIREVEKRLK